MAVATYNTDLSTIALMETGDTFEEFDGYSKGDGADLEADWYIQGSQCASDENNNKTGVGHSIAYDYGTGVTFDSGDCFFAWMYYLLPNAVDTFANGGYRVLIGGDLTNFDGWKVGGRDFGRNPYGGWVNVAVDPTHSTDYTGGAGGSGTYQYFGVAFNCTAGTLKGRPVSADAYRYGRGELYVELGEPGSYGTFLGMSAANDAQAARWGLFQEQAGGYLWKGLISLGTSANAVYFVDANRNITIDETPKTYRSFNKIEINHADTIVEWTGINISSLNGDGLSPGQLEVIDSTADVTIDTCTFTDMDTFIWGNNTTLDNTTFRRCNQVTQNGAIIDGCTFEESKSEISLLVNNLDNIDNCNFYSDSTNHAMELTSVHAGNSYNLVNCTYEGYATIDGNTGNEVIYNNSGGAVTIYVVGGDTPSIRNGSGASTTVIQAITYTLTNLVANSEVRIFEAGTTTELDGIENSGTSFIYSYNYPGSDFDIDIVIHKVEYIYIKLKNITMTSTNGTQKINQVVDRWYSNP